MNNKDMLQEATLNALLENKTYYEIMATNRGMWGGLSSPMKTKGKYIIFSNKPAAEEYLKELEGNASKVNNFNSYHIEAVEEDEINDYCLVVDSVEELNKKTQELKDAEKNQRQENINDILDIEKFTNELLEANKDLYNRYKVETKNTDSEYGNVEVTITARSKIPHKDYKLSDLYINVEIRNENGEIKLYYGSKEWFDKEELNTVKEKIKEIIDNFNKAQKEEE